MNDDTLTQTIEIPHASMRELRDRGELPTTKEGLAIELTLRVGELMASSGASAKETVVMMRRICHAYGLNRAQLDVTYNVIMASYYPGEGLPPVTAMRNVSPVLPNLSKVSKVNELVAQITGGISISRATRRFDRIRKSGPPYPVWLAALASGGISMTVQGFYTTSPKVLILALIVGVLINRFVYMLRLVGLPTIFQQLFGGWLVVAIAAGVAWLNGHPIIAFLGYISPTTIAVSCIFQMVAGARFVAGVHDAIDGYYVTATARVLEVIMLTTGLVIGLVTGLDAARRFGIAVQIDATAPVAGSVPIPFVAGAVTCTAILWAIGNFANLRTVLMTAGVTLFGWLAYWGVKQMPIDPVFASFAGPLVGAFIATVLVRRIWQVPVFGVINGMVLPYLPGLALYLGLIQMVGSSSADPDPSKGSATLFTAAVTALAISAGANLGVFLGRPVVEKLMLRPRSWHQMMTTPVSVKPKEKKAKPVLVQPPPSQISATTVREPSELPNLPEVDDGIFVQ